MERPLKPFKGLLLINFKNKRRNPQQSRNQQYMLCTQQPAKVTFVKCIHLNLVLLILQGLLPQIYDVRCDYHTVVKHNPKET